MNNGKIKKNSLKWKDTVSANINNFVKDVTKVFAKLNKSYEIIFVLDPSTDNTEKKILENIEKNKNVK